MKAYNGFSAEVRTKSLDYLRAEEKAGRVIRATVCQVCGQDKGIVGAHAEDYSEPFGPHIYAYALCYRCHMMLHCREGRGAGAWEQYKADIRAGMVFPPLMNYFFGPITQMLARRPVAGVTQGPARGPTWLDTLN